MSAHDPRTRPDTNAATGVDRRLCVAPMMDWTDRHCRMLHRRLSRNALLYTEMVTAQALKHGDAQKLLGFDREEGAVALQLGGSDPALLAAAAQLGERFGYVEINLNVGCPSDRVQSGRFGACLMREPTLVAECVAAMQAAVSIPVTVKCRLGVDEHDAWEDLVAFAAPVIEVGCRTFVVHARKAWLNGLSPRENREIPPLDYARVRRFKQTYPQLEVILNGGLADIATIESERFGLDGVMLGRAAYHEPFLLAQLDARWWGGALPDRTQVLRSLFPYVERELAAGTALKHMTRHWLGLFHGLPGARGFRRMLSENAHKPGAGIDLLERALGEVQAGTVASAA